MSSRFNTIAAITTAAGLATSFSSDARAQVFTWVNPLGGSWSDAASWSPSMVPNGPGQSAALTTGSYAVQLDQDVALDGLAIAEAIQLDVPAGRTLELGSLGLDSDGTVSIRASETQNSTLHISDDATLRGSGVLTLINSDYRSLLEITEGQTLVNEEGHTIRGDGLIRGSLVNNGTIESTASVWTFVLRGANTVNNGVIRATPESYAISIDDSGTFDNTDGRIIADGSWVFLSDIELLTGGTIATESNGLIRFYGDSTIEDIILDGDSQLDDWGTRTFRGTITNNGHMQMDPTSDNSSGETVFSEDATLGGVGELVLAPSTSPFWHEPADSALFEYGATHGPEHTIRGSGRLAGNFTNLGSIIADGDTPLRLHLPYENRQEMTSLGVLAATDSSVLELSGGLGGWSRSPSIMNQGRQTGSEPPEATGTLIADGGDIRIPENASVRIDGGRYESAGDGRLVTEINSRVILNEMTIAGRVEARNGGIVEIGGWSDIEGPVSASGGGSLRLGVQFEGGRITLHEELYLHASDAQNEPALGLHTRTELLGNATIHLNGPTSLQPGAEPLYPVAIVAMIDQNRAIDWDDSFILGPQTTLSGSGIIWGGFSVLGTITADQPSEHLVLTLSPNVNQNWYNLGTISAISANAEESGTTVGLDMYSLFQDIEWCGDDFLFAPPCPPSSGVLLADGPNARLVLEGDTVVYDGSIQTANGGRIEIPNSSAPGVANLDMDAEVNVRAGGTLYFDSGGTFAEEGLPPMELMSDGVITLHNHEAGNSAALFTDHRTILRGSGEIRCGLGSLVGVQLRPGQPDFRYDRWIDFGPDQTLTGSGHILGHFINRGTISVGLDTSESPEAQIGAMTADDLLTLTDASRLLLDLRDADTFESIDSTGTIELGGALHINALDPEALAAPTRFPILTAATITGRFDSTDLPEGTGFAWHLLYHPDRVELLATCPADVNTTGAAPDSAAWGEPDGVLNADDLTLFVERWLAGDPAADLTTMGSTPSDPAFGTPDGVVTVQDLTVFVELWIAGCP